MKVCRNFKKSLHFDLVKQIEALKINYFLEIHFSQTLIFTGSFIECSLIAFDFMANWCLRKRQFWSKYFELYNVSVQVRFATSKMKLDIESNKPGTSVASQVAK